MKEMQDAFVKNGNTECIYCSHGLILEEAEVSRSKLDKSGIILDYENAIYNAVLRCPKCGTEYPVERRGSFFKIGPLTSSYYIEQRLKKKDTNPFFDWSKS